MENNGWADNAPGLKRGMLVTFDGAYRRRTLWEWLTRKPRELQVFKIEDVITTPPIYAMRISSE